MARFGHSSVERVKAGASLAALARGIEVVGFHMYILEGGKTALRKQQGS